MQQPPFGGRGLTSWQEINRNNLFPTNLGDVYLVNKRWDFFGFAFLWWCHSIFLCVTTLKCWILIPTHPLYGTIKDYIFYSHSYLQFTCVVFDPLFDDHQFYEPPFHQSYNNATEICNLQYLWHSKFAFWEAISLNKIFSKICSHPIIHLLIIFVTPYLSQKNSVTPPSSFSWHLFGRKWWPPNILTIMMVLTKYWRVLRLFSFIAAGVVISAIVSSCL